jgi:deoxyribodipyrimidine photolyase
VPELSGVPLSKLARPWEAGHEAPIVDHAVERRRTLDAYAAARS